MSSNATALLERFAVFGRFYDARIGGEMRSLRSHLEIVDRQASVKLPWQRDADLVAIMMNPGASRPVGPGDIDGWATAQPDRTQYQLMKLALRAQAEGWALRHIRVINLSDLRTPKSAELFKALATMANGSHSIFNSTRCAELAQSLGGVRVPVLRAWGLARQLDGLARLAVAATPSRTVYGLTNNGFQYRHPLPQRADFQQQWLDQMELQLMSSRRAH